MATTSLREQLLAARGHVVAASIALDEIRIEFARGGDLAREDDTYAGVLLLADVMTGIDLLLMTDVGS